MYMNAVIIQLPIRPYLKKWIAKTNPIDPFVISVGSKCFYSSIILQKMEVRALPDVKESAGLTEYLNIQLPLAVINSKKFTITKDTVVHIDNNLRHMFAEQLKAHVEMIQKSRGHIFNEIDQFMRYYDISEDDCKFETLVKKYYRARLLKEEKTKMIHHPAASPAPDLFGQANG